MMQKVIDLQDVQIRSVNKKYIINRRTGRLVPSREYREFKNILEWACTGKSIEKPYRVKILLETYLDIDNPLKAILDSLNKIIEDDRYILELIVCKKPLKRGKKGKIKVFIETISDKKTEKLEEKK
jgi:Holliday junction resolvase RusA-like endonuclease